MAKEQKIRMNKISQELEATLCACYVERHKKIAIEKVKLGQVYVSPSGQIFA